MILRVPTRSQTPRPQTREHGTNQFAETRRIHRVQLVFVAVAHVVVVQRGSGQTHTLCRLVVVHEPSDCCRRNASGVA